RDRQGARLDRGFGARPGSELRGDRRSGSKGGAPYPAAGAACLPLTPNRLAPPRRDGAGQPHHHGACSRAALVLGRAGAAPWAALRLTCLVPRAGSSAGIVHSTALLNGCCSGAAMTTVDCPEVPWSVRLCRPCFPTSAPARSISWWSIRST